MTDFKSVYFDRYRSKQRAGKWVTVVKTGPIIELTEHPCEAIARASIGLEGGSMDQFYEPPNGETGNERVEL